MKKIDYFAIMALGLLFTIILAGQFGIFSSNVKQEGIQGNITLAVETILSKINQTEIFLHEDEQRDIQSEADRKYEDDARKNQTQISRAIIKEMRDDIKNLIYRYNNTTAKDTKYQNLVLQKVETILNNMSTAMDQNQNITKQNYQISKEHKQVAYDHDMIQNNVSNTTHKVDNQTVAIYNLLDYLGERNANLTQEGIIVQKENNKMLKELKPKINKIYEWILDY